MIPLETLNRCGERWADFMAYRVIDSTMVLALAGILWLVLRKRAAAQFGYLLFLLVLVKLIVPGPISAPGLIANWLPQPAADEGTSGQGLGLWGWWFGEGAAGYDRPTSSEESSAPSKSLTTGGAGFPVSIPTALMLGWAGIASALFARFFWMQWCTRRLVRKTKPLKRDALPINFDRLREIAEIKRSVQLVTGAWATSPVVWGIFRPTLIVPQDFFTRFTANQARWILLHELAHIRRHDNLVVFVQKILQILFFFHPGVWLANWIIDQLREYACDDKALSGSQAPFRDCGEGFLGVVLQANGLPTAVLASVGMFNSKTFIRRRLMRILDTKRTLRSRLSFSAAILALAISLVVLPFGGRVAIAQVGEWLKVEIPAGSSLRLTKPSSRVWHSMVYDSRRGVIVLHGGGTFSGGTTAYNDTWEYDGKTWTRVSTNGPGRYAHSMAYDEERGVTVLCGGPAVAGGTPLPGTWEWDGQEWKQVDANLPSGRLIPGMAYDPVRKVVVFHGGARDNSYNVFSDTWQWDGQTWTQLEDGPQRWDQEMEYDSVRGKMVMFGGYESRGVTPTDTWEFDGTHWKCAATEGPEGRCGHSMVFDPFRGVAVLLGGFIAIGQGSSADVYYYDMWEWNGEKWYQLDVTLKPQSCIVADMAFDEGRKKIVLFGGMRSWAVGESSDTWEYTAAGSGIPRSLWSLY